MVDVYRFLFFYVNLTLTWANKLTFWHFYIVL